MTQLIPTVDKTMNEFSEKELSDIPTRNGVINEQILDNFIKSSVSLCKVCERFGEATRDFF